MKMAAIASAKKLIDSFESSEGFVLPHVGGGKEPAIHSYINTAGQRLHKGQCTAEVKQSVRAAKLVRYHCTGKHNGLVLYFLFQKPGSFGHSVRSMGNDNMLFRRIIAIARDRHSIAVLHVETVHHEECL